VLVEDDGVSMSTIEPVTAGQNGAVAFATTHWSIVLTAQSELPAAREALENFAARIGGRFTPSCDTKATSMRKRKILPRVSLRFYWRGRAWTPSERRGDGCVLFCW